MNTPRQTSTNFSNCGLETIVETELKMAVAAPGLLANHVEKDVNFRPLFKDSGTESNKYSRGTGHHDLKSSSRRRQKRQKPF